MTTWELSHLLEECGWPAYNLPSWARPEAWTEPVPCHSLRPQNWETEPTFKTATAFCQPAGATGSVARAPVRH